MIKSDDSFYNNFKVYKESQEKRKMKYTELPQINKIIQQIEDSAIKYQFQKQKSEANILQLKSKILKENKSKQKNGILKQSQSIDQFPAVKINKKLNGIEKLPEKKIRQTKIQIKEEEAEESDYEKNYQLSTFQQQQQYQNFKNKFSFIKKDTFARKRQITFKDDTIDSFDSQLNFPELKPTQSQSVLNESDSSFQQPSQSKDSSLSFFLQKKTSSGIKLQKSSLISSLKLNSNKFSMNKQLIFSFSNNNNAANQMQQMVQFFQPNEEKFQEAFQLNEKLMEDWIKQNLKKTLDEFQSQKNLKWQLIIIDQSEEEENQPIKDEITIQKMIVQLSLFKGFINEIMDIILANICKMPEACVYFYYKIFYGQCKLENLVMNNFPQFLKYRIQSIINLKINEILQSFVLVFHTFSMILIQKILIELMESTKIPQRINNLKLLASLIQFIVLQAYYHTGRLKHEDKIMQIDFKSGHYTKNSSKNYDGVSNKLFKVRNLNFIYENNQNYFDQKVKDLKVIGQDLIKFIKESSITKKQS